MSIFRRHTSQATNRSRTVRAVERAARKAPSPAAREELLGLMTRL